MMLPTGVSTAASPAGLVQLRENVEILGKEEHTSHPYRQCHDREALIVDRRKLVQGVTRVARGQTA